MNEGQNLNNGGSGLGAAGGFDAFQNNNTFQNAGVGMQGSNSVGGMMGNDAPGAGGGIGVSGPIVSSGDDIMLGSGGDNGEQGSRKRLLLGVAAVVVVFALVAVGVFAMWKGGVFGGKSGGDSSNLNDMSIIDRFSNYYKLLKGGLYENSASENEWFYFEVVESGDVSDYEKKYLTELKKYYEGFMMSVNKSDMKYVKYGQVFKLYDNLANRFEIIDNLSKMNSLEVTSYIDELTKTQDGGEILAELALAENDYFINYNNESGNDYLARAISLVELTKHYFENMTNEIYRELGGDNA